MEESWPLFQETAFVFMVLTRSENNIREQTAAVEEKGREEKTNIGWNSEIQKKDQAWSDYIC